MKIYTRTGDDGTTGLFGGPRVFKDDARIEAYGTVDELNAVLGIIRTMKIAPDLDVQLEFVQHMLFSLGAELASPNPSATNTQLIRPEATAKLEAWIDQLERELPPLKQFILPMGTTVSAQMHLARNVCRRAERRVVTLANQSEGNVSIDLLHFLNRLSDLLFVQSRVVNIRQGLGDIPWKH